MQQIVFTLCSNNYLAHAKTLGDTLRQHSPGIRFVIGLVDERDPGIDYRVFEPYTIIPCMETGFDPFPEMVGRYNVIEFNTAVKPFYFEYLFRQYGADSRICYIDPDIAVYAPLEPLFALLEQHEVLITPNLLTLNLEVTTGELASLRHGMYNLGFIGMKHTAATAQFLKWWQNRLIRHCIIDKPRGLFVDQKWIDLAPLFFNNFHFINNPGYNMAWWNLDERRLIREGAHYFVNDNTQPLYFFHFSGYRPGSAYFTGRVNHYDFSFEARPELKPLFDEYTSWLKANDLDRLSAFKPLLAFESAKPRPSQTWKGKVKRTLKQIARKF